MTVKYGTETKIFHNLNPTADTLSISATSIHHRKLVFGLPFGENHMNIGPLC